MHKVDEHGVGGEHADGLVDEGGGGAPLSRLTATAPLKGSHISSIAKRSYISGVVSFAFKPVEGEAEEQNRADGVDEALRTELMIGVSEVQQAVALAFYCVVAAVHVPANRGEVQYDNTCRILMQKCEKFLPVHRRQTTADKDEQIMQRQVVQAIIKEILRQNAPGTAVDTGVRCPPVEKQLKNK